MFECYNKNTSSKIWSRYMISIWFNTDTLLFNLISSDPKAESPLGFSYDSISRSYLLSPKTFCPRLQCSDTDLQQQAGTVERFSKDRLRKFPTHYNSTTYSLSLWIGYMETKWRHRGCTHLTELWTVSRCYSYKVHFSVSKSEIYYKHLATLAQLDNMSVYPLQFFSDSWCVQISDIIK